MSSRKINYRQDIPPPGGYARIQFAKSIAPNKFTTWQLIIGVSAFMSYGWYKMWATSPIMNARRREKMERKIWLLPLLQAEEDRRFLRENYKLQKREAEVMADVPGWDATETVWQTTRHINPVAIPSILVKDPYVHRPVTRDFS